MNNRFRAIASILACALAFSAAAQAQQAATPASSPGRLREIAARWSEPAGVSPQAKRELDATIAAVEKKQTDAALARWRNVLSRADAGRRMFDVDAYLDFVLNRLAASRSASAAEACRRLSFYDAQETAISEHLSTVDKQLSAYGADDLSAVPLREPQLADYGGGNAEPVTLPPGASVGAKELRASLDRWRERLPAISQAREEAVDAFVKAVIGDAALAEEIQEVEATLRAEITETVPRTD